ncbi:hypothetical protein BD324DRAFT_636595 [Kockovaella imperatae]|uniref:Uncharacterized protein n=1 Tax=Kockovaella imperatae TaxID=4999 RepID=A0A1Y1U9B4_9TREE|nr:hypothetical protein BD324DRAFT_636595 [Kockovaella imperatae]ORX34602.1 hypothetical protein BD324DRAFT_636595 [Kockovaella imperatae]
MSRHSEPALPAYKQNEVHSLNAWNPSVKPPPYAVTLSHPSATPCTLMRDPLLIAAIREYDASRDPHQWGTRDSRVEAHRVEALRQDRNLYVPDQHSKRTTLGAWFIWLVELMAMPADPHGMPVLSSVGRPAWGLPYDLE